MSLINIGVTGLNSHQTALTTTGNNIANANVEGYSRQQVIFNARETQFLGSGFIGSGVEISTIERIHDQFVAAQVVTDTSRFEALNVVSNGLGTIDNILAGENTGLAGVLDDFFSAIQSASEAPSDLPLRQQVISEAERFVSRYQDISSVLESSLSEFTQSAAGIVEEVNQISSAIANLNSSISEATAASGAAPNNLLDSRDQLLRDLAERVDFNSIVQDGDTVNVYLNSGQALVLGTQSNELSVVQATIASDQIEIGISEFGGDVQIVSDGIQGGRLGGQLSVREQGINDVTNQLGLLATLAIDSFNSVHNQGVDLNGLQGGDLFTPIDDRALQLSRVEVPASNSDPIAIASVQIDDVAQLRADSYALTFEGASVLSYQLTRESDGAVVAEGSFSGAVPLSITSSDGFTVNLEQGSFSAGDTLAVRPANFPADQLEVLIQSPQSLAFGLPISLEAAAGNTGTGLAIQPSAPDVANLLANNAQGGSTLTAEPLLIRFTSPTTYDILDNSDPDNPVAFVPPITAQPFTPGRNNTLLAANDSSAGVTVGFDIVIGGVPQAGDEFTIDFDSNAGDNTNALALAGLQTSNVLASGVGSLGDIYANVVGTLGIATASANIDAEAASSLLSRSTNELLSISGVNLDEEAANLLQFEQAYNASAQVIAIARSIFDSLLLAFR